MLKSLDILYTIIHLLIIGFNLFGWIWPRTRRAHLIIMTATAASWFILGIWFGWGYCPITDWQWDVKEKLGERDLPASFITYFANKISGKNFSDALVNNVTLVIFLILIMITVYVNFFRKRSTRS